MSIFEAIESWCLSNKVNKILFGVNTDNTILRFLTKNGYSISELTMVKEV